MINTAYFLAVILVFLRLIGFFAVIPVFFPKGLPNVAKVGLTVIMAFILVPGVDYSRIGTISSNMQFFVSAFDEVVTGLVLGYVVNLCFFSIRMAGQLMDQSIGFSMVNIFDPNSNSSATLIQNLFYWFSVIIFFIIDGHHMLITALIESFNIIGLGKFILAQKSIMVVINSFISFFALGVKIAIPIVLIILITDITLGLISRTVPQINVMILGLPIKILVGLGCFILSIPILTKVIISIFSGSPNILRDLFKVIPFIVIFASEDKTEEATPKKKSDARKKGQVPRSKEVGLALTLLSSTIVLVTLGGYIGNSLKATVIAFIGSKLNMNLTYDSLQGVAFLALWRVAIVVLPVVIPIMVMGIAANILQTGFLFTGEPLTPKFSKINPLSGFKRMFSFRSFVDTLRNSLIVTVLCYIGYTFIRDNYSYILSIGNMQVGDIPAAFGKLVISILIKITIAMITVAAIDYFYQRYQYNKDLKMTKQEIKEEYKQQEGDPQVKSKRRQKQREMAMGRMMQAVPKATVVVTNPTHIAVALRYEDGNDSAPMLVAKGADNVAIKIKEIAKEHDVPILENRSLARLIYNEVEIDSEIPTDMYQAVAEILAIVYKLKKKK